MATQLTGCIGDAESAASGRLQTGSLLNRVVTIVALLGSAASLMLVTGGGLALLAIEVSGERAIGALLAIGGIVAFVAVTMLAFARLGTFGYGLRKALAIGAAIVGAIPPAGIAFVAIRFVGLPIGSRMPLVDWTVLIVGLLFGLGTLSVLALGHRRTLERSADNDDAPVIVHMQQIRSAQQQLRAAFQADAPSRAAEDYEDDIRVRRV